MQLLAHSLSLESNVCLANIDKGESYSVPISCFRGKGRKNILWCTFHSSRKRHNKVSLARSRIHVCFAKSHKKKRAHNMERDFFISSRAEMSLFRSIKVQNEARPIFPLRPSSCKRLFLGGAYILYCAVHGNPGRICPPWSVQLNERKKDPPLWIPRASNSFMFSFLERADICNGCIFTLLLTERLSFVSRETFSFSVNELKTRVVFSFQMVAFREGKKFFQFELRVE